MVFAKASAYLGNRISLLLQLVGNNSPAKYKIEVSSRREDVPTDHLVDDSVKDGEPLVDGVPLLQGLLEDVYNLHSLLFGKEQTS